MADEYGRFDPERHRVDAQRAAELGLDRLIDQQWAPLLPSAGPGRPQVAAVGADRRQRRQQVRSQSGAQAGDRVEVLDADNKHVTDLLLEAFDQEIATDASESLHRANPLASAWTVFTKSQAILLIVLTLAVVVSAIIWPRMTLSAMIATAGVVFLICTAFKFAVAIRGATHDVVEYVGRREIANIDEDDLPVYTVLVPVYREENIVAQLVGNLGGIDYPEDKLEVLILIEAEDDATREAVMRADPPSNFHVVIVPDGQPRTKPRACNVGLRFARGEYLVIFDAEDIPEPDQLKKAVTAFRRSDEKTVVLQASLNYYNSTENVLTRMFTLEYNYWFYYMLPGLDTFGLPIPLGGTSNHFRTSALRELGGWDPHNVTEDADLGIRAAAEGYRVGVINSTTMEEANTSVPNFIRQRSRWIKGYLQTVLVHARQPRTLISRVGVIPFLAFLVLIGGTPASFLLVLPFMILTAVAVVIPDVVLALQLPAWVLWLGMVNFFIGSALMVHLTMMGPFKRGTFMLVPWALLNPAYWVLHSIASYKALWQLLTRPHYWEKTQHGLTEHDHEDAAAQIQGTPGGVVENVEARNG